MSTSYSNLTNSRISIVLNVLVVPEQRIIPPVNSPRSVTDVTILEDLARRTRMKREHPRDGS